MPNNGRVPHEMGSNRVYTMRVREEANVRDTALVCQLKTHSVLQVFRTVEFRRILQNYADFR